MGNSPGSIFPLGGASNANVSFYVRKQAYLRRKPQEDAVGGLYRPTPSLPPISSAHRQVLQQTVIPEGFEKIFARHNCYLTRAPHSSNWINPWYGSLYKLFDESISGKEGEMKRYFPKSNGLTGTITKCKVWSLHWALFEPTNPTRPLEKNSKIWI